MEKNIYPKKNQEKILPKSGYFGIYMLLVIFRWTYLLILNLIKIPKFCFSEFFLCISPIQKNSWKCFYYPQCPNNLTEIIPFPVCVMVYSSWKKPKRSLLPMTAKLTALWNCSSPSPFPIRISQTGTGTQHKLTNKSI